MTVVAASKKFNLKQMQFQALRSIALCNRRPFGWEICQQPAPPRFGATDGLLDDADMLRQSGRLLLMIWQQQTILAPVEAKGGLNQWLSFRRIRFQRIAVSQIPSDFAL